MSPSARTGGVVAADVRGMAKERRQHHVQAAQARKGHVHQGQQSHLRRPRARAGSSCRVSPGGNSILPPGLLTAPARRPAVPLSRCPAIPLSRYPAVASAGGSRLPSYTLPPIRTTAIWGRHRYRVPVTRVTLLSIEG